MTKRPYLCLETLALDMEEYGVDFIAGKVYFGDRESGYIDSGENGTSVHFCTSEFERYFKEFIKDNSMENTVDDLLADAQSRSQGAVDNSHKHAFERDIDKE